jgi:LCP family protein required for cell wall assembly
MKSVIFYRLFPLLALLAALVAGAACGGVSQQAAIVTPSPFAGVDATAEAETTATADDSGPGATGEPATPEAEPVQSPSPDDPADDEAQPAEPEPSPAPDDTPRPEATSPPPPSPTPQPTPSPTSRPLVVPTRAVVGTGSLSEGVPTPVTPIPSPVPTFDVPDGTINILLLGDDTGSAGAEDGRSDTMIIVSINQETGTASMLSLPRDLFVYLPTRTMSRLNTAVALGGPELLEQAILYNFGIPINYYAQVNFDGFKQIVDQIGGVEMAVSCRLQDWRLKSPELDPTVEDNWAQFALEPGVYRMDGDLALWYARSRLTTSDFDRGRRQQQLLRAMLNQGVDLGLVARAPELWGLFRDVVNTDLDIGRILQLAAIAPTVAENGVQSLYLAGKTQSWVVPDSGAQIQLPIWEGDGMMQQTFQRLLLPPALNKAERAPITVEVINASGVPDMTALAVDNLAWYGFVPVVGETPAAPEPKTRAIYYGDNFKGSFEWLLSWVVGVPQSAVELSDEESEANYRVILGEDYDPCRPAFNAPQAFLVGS